jgi:DNA (cytosine-5)-methyltransferase 1
MARIIHEVQPRYVFVENSPMLTSRGLGRVLGDLASMGFDAKWGVLGAADVGAKHQRDRIWIVATSNSNSKSNAMRGNCQDHAESMGERGIHIGRGFGSSRKGCEEVSGQSASLANPSLSGLTPCNDTPSRPKKPLLEKQLGRSCNEYGTAKQWWEAEPNVGRVVNGMASRVDRLKAIGNGQVPLCAATAWRILK